MDANELDLIDVADDQPGEIQRERVGGAAGGGVAGQQRVDVWIDAGVAPEVARTAGLREVDAVDGGGPVIAVADCRDDRRAARSAKPPLKLASKVLSTRVWSVCPML